MDIKRIPVFVFPSTLNFYLSAKHTHKQLLTLYNPYDFPVRFKVLCNAPTKYTVIDPEGSIGPRACVDIVVRHSYPIAANCNVVDKFRIAMLDHVTKETIGKRDIESKLLPGEPDNSSNDGGDNFQTAIKGEKLEERPLSRQTTTTGIQSTNSATYIAILAALVSIIGLMLPTKVERQEETPIPEYLHISSHLKFAFAYVLGLVSYVLLRT